MIEPWKIRSLAVENFVGYGRLEWPQVDAEFNLILGQNGVGKSMLFEVLLAALKYLQGWHARDTVIGNLPNVTIEVARVGDASAQRFTTRDIQSIQGYRATGWHCSIFHVVENRQPKNKIGRVGAVSDDNAIMRYPAALAKLQSTLRSGTDADVALAETVKRYCRLLPMVASSEEWERIWATILERGPNTARPASCGQFDALALIVDLVSFQQKLLGEPAPHYVVFDNPETYLHPAAVGPFLDLMREALPAAQFFVASHGVRGVFYPRQKSVFFLPRDARTQPKVALLPLTQAPQAARDAFLELYGTGAGSGFLATVGELESPVYHRFLTDCIHECGPKERREPKSDRQLGHTVSLLDAPDLAILDVGAGHGELLDALEHQRQGAPCRYFGFDEQPQAKLADRIRRGIATGLLAPESRVIASLEEDVPRCDTAVFLNLCHHLDIPTLAEYLAAILQRRIHRRAGAGLLIVELRTLATGERDFVLWTPDDLRRLFAPWPELSVTHRPLDGRFPEEGHEATLIRWTHDEASAVIESEPLAEGLRRMLPSKREAILEELERRRTNMPERGEATYWHQKRVAFLCAALAWIARAEWLPEHRRAPTCS